MRKAMVFVVAALAVFTLFANGEKEKEAGAAFVPTKDVSWICTSKPGGGSDIFTQVIKDAMKSGGISDANIVVSYVTDGGGEVGRLQVATTPEAKADHQLLTFNSGDLMPMVKNTDNRIQNFTPLAVMAVDKQLLFIGEHSKYANFTEVIDALKDGAKIVIAGSKGDDIATYEALVKELGVSQNQLAYITNDSTSGAITSLLGGHVDLCMSKPAAASEYVKAGKMVAILALSTTRFTVPGLTDAPTLSELGYNNVEVPVWRGVVAPGAMSPEAAAYWGRCLKAVSETEAWKEYITKKGLIAEFKGGQDAIDFMRNYQDDYLKKIGR